MLIVTIIVIIIAITIQFFSDAAETLGTIVDQSDRKEIYYGEGDVLPELGCLCQGGQRAKVDVAIGITSRSKQPRRYRRPDQQKKQKDSRRRLG